MRFIFVLFLLALFVPAQASAAVLYLKNGDRISGTVITKRDAQNRLSLRADYGVLQVPWEDIEKLADNEISARSSAWPGGYLTPTERSRRILAEQGMTQAAPKQRQFATAEAAPEKEEDEKGLWGAKWSGSVSFGASLQGGNTQKNDITGDAEVKARWEDHRATLRSEFDRAKDEGVLTVDNREIEGIYDYFFTEEWFFNSSLGFKQDDIALLDLRTTVGLGLGHQPFDRDDLHLQYVFGPTYLHEEYENGNDDESFAGEWQLSYDQKFWEGQLGLFHNHDLLVPSDDTEAFLFESESGIKIPLKAGIIGKAQIEFDWDNKPPTGTREDDTIYSLQIGYEW